MVIGIEIKFLKNVGVREARKRVPQARNQRKEKMKI